MEDAVNDAAVVNAIPTFNSMTQLGSATSLVKGASSASRSSSPFQSSARPSPALNLACSSSGAGARETSADALAVGRFASAYSQHEWTARVASALKQCADELRRDRAARDGAIRNGV